MKLTFKQMCELNTEYIELVKSKPAIPKTKFGYAWKRFFEKGIEPVFNEYNLLIAGIRIDCALTDKTTGEVMLDANSVRQFKFDKEGMKKVMKLEQDLQNEWNPKEYDVEPYFCTDTAPSLSDQEKEIFFGTIIKDPNAREA